jgi:hypothetical protein
LVGCSDSGEQAPKSTSASLVPADAVAYLSFELTPAKGQRDALTQAFTPSGGRRPTFAAARAQLLAGLGRRLEIDVAKDVTPWARDEVALAVLAGGSPVLVTTVADAAAAETALTTAKRAHRRIGERMVIGKDAAALDTLVASSAPGTSLPPGSLAATERYQRVVAGAPADRLGIGVVDERVCRADAKGRLDFSLRADRHGLLAEGTAGGSLADMAPGDPSATNSLPADTLASLTVFDGRTLNDVADAAFGCIPMLTPTPSATTLLSAGLPPPVPPNFGVNVERDVMPWLRGETVVALGPPRNPSAVADVGVIVRPADTAAAATALPHIEDGLALGGQFQWTPRDQGGAHFLTVPAPIGGVGGLQPAIGLVNGRVVVASSPDYFVSLARPRDPRLGSSNQYQDDVSHPSGPTLARAVVHLTETRDLFGGRVPLGLTANDPLLSKADTLAFTLARDGKVTRFRLLLRFSPSSRSG